MKNIMEIKVIREKCIGCGTCVALAGGTFEMDEENIAVVKDGPTDDKETIQMATDSCPTQAIEIEE